MVQSAHPASADDLDRFDPERFRIEQPGADPLVEAIPVDETITDRDRTTRRFAIVPLAAVRHFPPAARILLMLTYVQHFYGPDIDGGWYRLRTGIATDFHLRDKDVRRHVLAALEKAGLIEVLRTPGKSPFLRLSPDHVAAFQHVSLLRRQRRAVRMRICEIGKGGATVGFIDC